MNTVSFFKVSARGREMYALIVSGIGGALFEIMGDCPVVAKTSGRMTPDLASLCLLGLAGKSAGVDCVGWARRIPSFPDVTSFDQLCAFLELTDQARTREDLSRILGLTQQRVKQLLTQRETTPTKKTFDRLIKYCEQSQNEHVETLKDMVHLLSSRAKEKLGALYDRV